ncbi:MAG: PrsW family intramembrane metalloprotease, partial [Caldilineales bacterium]|nr:PrsW family intramembrane metalloprotease [Caldilineales bacterium]
MIPLLILSLLAAVLPTGLYVALVVWSDRYEREPGWLLTTAFGWGALPAVALSIVGTLALGHPQALFDSDLAASLFQAVVAAPIVEEIAKGLALVGIVVFVGHEVDGVLDGLVYGALIGMGFAMTENFFYVLDAALRQDYLNWLVVTFLRTVVFGLNHAFYTAIVGVTLAVASRTRRRWWLPALGLVAAMGVH